MSEHRHIYLIAGEASGDFLGAQLMKALREKTAGQIRFSGIGGPLMTAQGLESLFPMEELSVMGIAEILLKITNLLKRIKQTIEDIEKKQPDILVTIDAPDFSFRVVKGVRKRRMTQPKTVHYVAPSVWAWRPGRAKKIARFLDGLICLFDFEPPYFEKEGLRAIAAGHPMAEGDLLSCDGRIFRQSENIGTEEKTLGLLFGSRHGEIKRIGPVLRDAALMVAGKSSTPPAIIAPTLPHLKEKVETLLEGYPGSVHVITDPEKKWSAFSACDTAIAVSGTVGLELAAADIPHVIAFNMNPVTWEILKRVIKVRHAHLANIMLDRTIVPEFIQHECTPQKIAESALNLLNNPQEAAAQKRAFADIRRRIGVGEVQTPSQKAAGFILEL